MMEFPLQIEKIIGLSGENKACGVFSKRITFEDETVGTIVSCILARDGKKEDIQTNLNDIFEVVTRKLEVTVSGVLEALRLAGEAYNDYISRYGLTINYAHAVFYKEACYLAKKGDEVKISVFAPPKSSEINFEFGSGPVRAGQIYLIGTGAFFSIFENDSLLQEPEVELREVIDGLATEISAKEDQGDVGAVFVLVKAPNEEVLEKKSTEEELRPVESRANLREDLPGGVEEKVVSEKGYKFPLKNLLLGFLKTMWREIGKLKRGDVGAILRLRRNIVVVVFLVVLILISSAVFAVGERNKKTRMADFNVHLSQASSKYNEALAIMQLNKSRAREILIEADKEVKEALTGDSKNKEGQKLAEDILAKLRETESSASVNFQVLAEVSKPLVSVVRMDKKLIGVSSGKIFDIDVATKSVKEIDGPDGAKTGFGYSGSAFVLADDGVFKVDLAKKETKEIIKKEQVHDLSVFLGNVYLLLGDAIFKFVPTEEGYLQGPDYLNEKIEFGDNSRFAIDGSVWVTAGDKIYKFMRGKNENFEISGLPNTSSRFSLLYTDSSLDNLYVLDSTNSALLVIDKKGTYQKAYQSGEFGKMTGFVVNEAGGEMYISIGSRILEADL